MSMTQSMLQELVTTSGYSVANIAQATGTCNKTVQRLLNGEAKPSIKSAANIMRLYSFNIVKTNEKINDNATKHLPDKQKMEKAVLFTRPPQILLITSDSITQQIHKEFLETLQCEVTILSKAAEIFAKCSDKFDLIFVDPFLSDINGLMVAAAMRAKYHQFIPIIALTRHKTANKLDCDWLTIAEIAIAPLSLINLKEILQRHLPKLLKQASI